MSIDLERDLRTYVKYLDAVNTQEAEGDVLTVAGPRVASPSGWKPRAWAVAVAVVAVLALGSITLLTGQTPPEVPLLSVDPPAVDESGALPTRSTPLPDFEGAVLGDDGSGPLSLGVVNDLPNEDRLDFLFEFCGRDGPDCFRDAHFMDPNNSQVGSGVWTADRPFHVRHGFINNGEESLGEGFDVVVYVTSLDGTPSEFGGVPAGATVRYTSDYVLRGSSDQCGPTYRSQTQPETCEWFVHDFSDGLPEGRHAIWAVWEAPCSAWLDLGLSESCDNPNEITSMFSSGYDGPFGPFEPSYTEANQAGLTDEEAAEQFRENSGSTGQQPPLNVQPPVDATGASPTGGTPLPDFEGAVPGDDGSGPLSLGVVNDLPNEDRLDFLFEFCGRDGPDCFRDAHFMDPNNSQVGSGVWTADRPFHVRHGFINNGEESLGEGFDVVVYVTSLDGTPSEFGGVPAGATVRYTSDYVLRGSSDQCGPTYRSQTESETCEWFVHDFSDGLPEGRHAIWAVWEAPCSAWLDMGLTESCDNPDQITSMFSSGYDGPFEPSFTEANEAPQVYR